MDFSASKQWFKYLISSLICICGIHARTQKKNHFKWNLTINLFLNVIYLRISLLECRWPDLWPEVAINLGKPEMQTLWFCWSLKAVI